MKYNRY